MFPLFVEVIYGQPLQGHQFGILRTRNLINTFQKSTVSIKHSKRTTHHDMSSMRIMSVSRMTQRPIVVFESISVESRYKTAGCVELNLEKKTRKNF